MKFTSAALLASGASAFTSTTNTLQPQTVRAAAPAQAPSMAVAGGINGFGRIGRLVARIMAKSDAIDLKLVNSGAANEYMAYQFKYDSIHGRYPGTIEPTADGLMIDGVLTPTTHTRDPSEIPFGAMGAEYICESTGAFLTADKVAPHIAAGAKKIIFSAPAKDDSPTVVMGVNEETYDPSMVAVSCASCTTNGLAPMVKAINDKFGIEEGLMTTVHAMTATQKVVDGRRQGRRQGHPRRQGQAHGHGLPRADRRRLRRRPHGQAQHGDVLRRHLRRGLAPRRRPDDGHPRLLRRAPRLDRLRDRADVVRLRRRGGHHALAQVRQVRRLVRQRVGLLEPRRRPHVPHGRRRRQGRRVDVLYVPSPLRHA